MLAFHNDPAVKQDYLCRVRGHRIAGEVIQGYGYWRHGCGCAVGCTIHGTNLFEYEAKLGIPAHLAYLKERIFEHLPAGSAPGWPELFLQSIRVGADLSRVWPEFAAWLLTDSADGVIQFVKEDQLDPDLGRRVRESIESIAQLFRTGSTDTNQWSVAMKMAFEAKESADDSLSIHGRESNQPCPIWAATNAISAAYLAARSHTKLPLYVPGEALQSAASARLASFSDARSKGTAPVFVRMAEKLVALLRAA